MEKMKAIVVRSFGGPSVLEYVTNWPIPKVQEKNSICVRVHAAGVNPVETYKRAGSMGYRLALPYIPGDDGAGVVEECGPAVSKFKKGDRVFFTKSLTGSYAQFSLVLEDNVSHLHNLSFEEGASVGIPYHTAYVALKKAQLKAAQTLLIHGASGGVGLACVQLASKMGAVVLGTAGTDQGMQLVKQNGASQVFNHRKPAYVEEIMGVGKVDVVIEMLADVNLQKDLDIVAKGGCIVVVGSRGPVEIMPRTLMSKECTITGVHLPTDKRELTAYIDECNRQGVVKPVVGKILALTEAAEAHEEVIQHTGGTHGKIILSVPQD